MDFVLYKGTWKKSVPPHKSLYESLFLCKRMLKMGGGIIDKYF